MEQYFATSLHNNVMNFALQVYSKLVLNCEMTANCRLDTKRIKADNHKKFVTLLCKFVVKCCALAKHSKNIYKYMHASQS